MHRKQLEKLRGKGAQPRSGPASVVPRGPTQDGIPRPGQATLRVRSPPGPRRRHGHRPAGGGGPWSR